ncbi:MAG: acetyltransferase [Opitutaceae bacterium]|jgi:sugar O-acyltransferase (sialic acid O-acetyltransferase NeuD family)
MKSLIIIFAGGAGIEAAWVARRMGGWTIEGFADDAAALRGTTICDTPVLGTVQGVLDKYQGSAPYFHCASGDNRLRARLAGLFEARGFRPATLIDPSAIVATTARIGAGCYLAPQVFVGPEAVLQHHVLVNVAASLGHHCIADDFVQICPGARISGKARLETGAFVGSNGTVAPGIRIGEWSSLGAGSLAARDIPPRVSALGVPARVTAPASTN